MKRSILATLLIATMIIAGSRSTIAAPIDCKAIFGRCVEDCRQVFDIGVLKDACAVGCFIGYLGCE